MRAAVGVEEYRQRAAIVAGRQYERGLQLARRGQVEADLMIEFGALGERFDLERIARFRMYDGRRAGVLHRC